jgi:hypothetical protein
MNETLVTSKEFSITTDFSRAQIEEQNLQLLVTEEGNTIEVLWGDFYLVFLKTVKGLVLVGEGENGCGTTVVTNGQPSNPGFNSLMRNGRNLWIVPNL